MPISGKFFPSQVSGERVFLLIRRHWIVFATIIFFVVVLLIPVLVLIIYWVSNPDVFSGPIGNFAIIIGGSYTLTALGLLLYGFVNYYLDVYIVTNKRIVDIKQKGFFSREIAELHLHQIQDVEAEVEGFLQTLIHFGSIHIQTAGERENFIFEDVPHPYTLAKQIIELHEASIEAEYEPKVHRDQGAADDYRPEDYFHPEEEKNDQQEPAVDEAAAKTDGSKSQSMSDDEFEGGIKYLEESYRPSAGEKITSDDSLFPPNEESKNQQPIEEFGFGSGNASNPEKFEKELKELSEGQEVSLDDTDREV
ncbi:MAG: PH domain-containing protein [Candidatus Berkelbacteria bacterium]